MRSLVLLAVVLPALNSAEDWAVDWEECSDALGSEPPQAPIGSQPRGSFQGLELGQQLVTIDADTGKLKIQDQSEFWAQLATMTDKARMILTFGGERIGKSIIASFLGCSMQGPLADYFPTFNGNEQGGRIHTEGIWASNPFSIPGVEGKYIILDMQSVDSILPFQGKLSYTRKDDNLHKLLALMSEVVSTFVFVTRAANNLYPSVPEWNKLGLAMSETRQNMVMMSRDNAGAPISQDLNLKSHNSPTLIIAPQQQAKQDVMQPNEWAVNTQLLYERAFKAKDILSKDEDDSGAGIYSMLERNFQMITNGDQGDIPWLFAPMQTVAQSGANRDNFRFNWGATAGAYKFEPGAHCTIYDRMNSSRWRCWDATAGGKVPSEPATYGLMVDYLAETLKTQAPVRQLSWQGQDNPTSLTLDKIKVVLEQGIKEMNAIGPLPRSELWRRIMEDRCFGEIVEYLDYTYGEKSGVYPAGGNYTQGILNEISEGLIELGSGTIPELTTMRARWAELDKKWTSKKDIDIAMNEWFVRHPLLESVRTTCTKEGTQHKALLDQTYETKVQEWTAILANKERALAEEALRQALETSWWKAFWDEWKLYIMVGAVVMIPVLLILCRMWRAVNGTCRACAMCCGDWGDTTTTTKIITVGAGGGSSSRNAPVERGPAVPFASALAVPLGGSAPGSSSEDPNARIEKISNTIKELQKRASR